MINSTNLIVATTPDLPSAISFLITNYKICRCKKKKKKKKRKKKKKKRREQLR
jgi:hypothetical protein